MFTEEFLDNLDKNKISIGAVISEKNLLKIIIIIQAWQSYRSYYGKTPQFFIYI